MSSTSSLPRLAGRGRLVGAAIALGQGPPRVGHPVELDVIRARHVPVEVSQELVDPHRLLDGVQPERRDGLDRHGGDDAERPEADTGGREHVGVLLRGRVDDRAVPGDQPQAHDAAGDVAEVPARAVGGRRGGAGDRLVPDVAHVLEREAALVELVAQRGEGDARLHRDRASLPVVIQHSVVVGEVDEHAVGARDGREAVTGADALHTGAGRGGLLDDGDQLVLTARPPDGGGSAGLVAGPVRPGCPALHRHGRNLVGVPPPRAWVLAPWLGASDRGGMHP